MDGIKKMDKEGKNYEEIFEGIPNFWLTAFQNANKTLLNSLFEKRMNQFLDIWKMVTITIP